MTSKPETKLIGADEELKKAVARILAMEEGNYWEDQAIIEAERAKRTTSQLIIHYGKNDQTNQTRS